MRLADQLLKLDPQNHSSIAWIERTTEWAVSNTWTWLEIKKRTAAIAAYLLDHGISPGDRIVNLGRNSLEWALLDLACSTINAVHVPLDPRMSDSQLKRCVDVTEPAMVFAETPFDQQFDLMQLREVEDVAATLERLAVPHQPHDLANILFTSGTTGPPRGVMLSHRNLVSNAIAKLDAMPQSPQDHRLNFLPFSHAYARTCELSAWLMSYSSMEVAFGIDQVLARASTVAPTLINGVPLFYDRLFQQWQRDGGSKEAMSAILGNRIRRLASGGAALPSEVRANMANIGLPIYQGYGLTESSPVICSNRASRPGRQEQPNLLEVGPTVQGVRVRIDESSKLWVSGDGVMLGYWRDPTTTQQKIVDGWLDTGDLAEFVCASHGSEQQTAVRILGRCDDTIVLSNGYKIEPMPIEQRISEQPWCAGCLLVGRSRPFAVLILRTAENGPQSTEESLLTKIDTLLADFPKHAKPRRILIIKDVWSGENGLTNFKGTPLRPKIEGKYHSALDQIYHA